jgi:hypothetical protein
VQRVSKGATSDAASWDEQMSEGKALSERKEVNRYDAPI